jgi:hypothetical protein
MVLQCRCIRRFVQCIRSGLVLLQTDFTRGFCFNFGLPLSSRLQFWTRRSSFASEAVTCLCLSRIFQLCPCSTDKLDRTVTCYFKYFFWRARVCFCRPFCIFERCLDSNPDSCRSKQVCYQLIHPSPYFATHLPTT